MRRSFFGEWQLQGDLRRGIEISAGKLVVQGVRGRVGEPASRAEHVSGTFKHVCGERKRVRGALP